MRARASSTATQANGTSRRAACRPKRMPEGGNQRAKKCMVEAEIETEEDENSGGDGLVEAAVEVHRLVDPVTVTQVPDEAADVTKRRSLTEGKWISLSYCCREAPKAEEEARSSRRRCAREAWGRRWERAEPEGRRRVRPWPRAAGELVASRLKSNIGLSIGNLVSGDTIQSVWILSIHLVAKVVVPLFFIGMAGLCRRDCD